MTGKGTGRYDVVVGGGLGGSPLLANTLAALDRFGLGAPRQPVQVSR